MSHVGEIIASSTTRFTAQCPDEDSAPDLGTFVVVDSPPGRAIAVVAEVRCGSVDANRRPMAFGLSEDELFAQQPQLRELLSTEFDALLVGHAAEGGSWRQLLPPRPPRLHRFAHAATADDVRAVTANGDWLRTLSTAQASDDVLASAVRASLDAHGRAPELLVHTGQALARLLGDDYDRLQVVLRRIKA